MFNNSSHTFNIYLSKSILIDEKLIDLVPGQKAGITYLIHTKGRNSVVERIKVKDFIRTKFKNEMIKPILVDKINKLIFQ